MKIAKILALIAAATATCALGQATMPDAARGEDARAAGDNGRDWYYTNSPAARDARQYDRQVPLDFPSADLREYAFARARAIVTKYETHRTRERLGEHIDRLTRQFEATAEFADARQAEEDAWAGYQTAVASVTARLLNDPEFAANHDLATDIGQQIRDTAYSGYGMNGLKLRGGDTVSPVVYELAHAKLAYARRASAMRAQAMALDPAVAEARAKLQSASAALGDLRKAFQARLKDDEVVLSLREELERAQIAELAAAAYSKVSKIIANESIRYARYLHRSDSYPYYGSPYAGSGFYDYYVRPTVNPYGAGYRGVVQAVNDGGYGYRRR